MKREIVKLDGVLLDAAVAWANAMNQDYASNGMIWHTTVLSDEPVEQVFRYIDIVRNAWLCRVGRQRDLLAGMGEEYRPSTDWKFGGPIIEREQIELHRTEVMPYIWEYEAYCGGFSVTHHRPLVAAMRAYTRYKIGLEIELP